MKVVFWRMHTTYLLNLSNDISTTHGILEADRLIAGISCSLSDCLEEVGETLFTVN